MLIEKGALPPHLFSPEIRTSWQRCYKLGLDPYEAPKLNTIHPDKLAGLRERNQLIRRLALVEMRNLHQQIAGSNFIIVFANGDGIILDKISEEGVCSERAASSITPGNIWSEDSKGTNGIGLVTLSGKPSIVHGCEHYFTEYSALTCTAAPIFDPFGKMAGILDATSDCHSRQQHTLALVRMSCLTIENSLFRNHYMKKLILEFHSRHEFLGTLHSGMIAFEQDGLLVRANRRAKFLLHPISLRPRTHFSEIFSTSFDAFVDNLHREPLIELKDIKGSTFAVKAFNFFPNKFHTIPSRPLNSEKQLKRLKMVYEDPHVESAIKTVERAVRVHAPILIRGETGTGKELLARYAHIVSGRKGNFVAMNCAALTENLVESELFGYADGAFTGAARGGSVGLVRRAHNGTLFLDEIGVMSPQLQAKLLRFLDSWRVRPVGATKDVLVDIQLVSATNSDLMEEVGSGNFRRDLLYRINAVEVVLPPLRDRSDFESIARMTIYTIAPRLQIESEVLELMKIYAWPGNIRELRSFITRLAIDAEQGIIGEKDVRVLLRRLPRKTSGRHQRKELADQVRGIVLDAYSRHKGNISAVARELGISRNKVYKKLKEARL